MTIMTGQPATINRSQALGRKLPIYLDHHATTPIDPRVAAVVFKTMTETFGNAQSVNHVFGERAAAAVNDAAVAVSELLDAPTEQIRFTSGATEAIRIAIGIAKSNTDSLRVAVCRVEHKAVLDPLLALEKSGQATLRWIDVDEAGRVSLDDISSAINAGIDLLCLMAANNEVGTIYPIQKAAALASAAGVQILVDATPAVGHTPLRVADWDIDYLVLSAHKLYGPKGAGALIGPTARSALADMVGGHPGTLNVPCIAGFGAACRLKLIEGAADELHVTALRDRLEAALRDQTPELVINGDHARRLGNNLHISAPGAPNDAVLARLHRSIAISTGAACSSGAQELSHVLRAMKLSSDLQESALRISTGKFNTMEEIDYAASEISAAIAAAAMRTSK